MTLASLIFLIAELIGLVALGTLLLIVIIFAITLAVAMVRSLVVAWRGKKNTVEKRATALPAEKAFNGFPPRDEDFRPNPYFGGNDAHA